MPDLLSTKAGRLSAFFLLYVTEGVPQGFTAVAVATQMRRQGLTAAEVGAFVASLYLPWAWKWLAGPVVDLVASERLGRRRAWIVGCQLVMAATLLVAGRVDFATALHLFTAIVLVHNVFAATQDVAIDALAVEALPAAERGTASGLMFAGAYAGAAVGGAGVLYLTAWVGFDAAFYAVAGLILLVTTTVSVRLRERPTTITTKTTSPKAPAGSGASDGPSEPASEAAGRADSAVPVLSYESPPTTPAPASPGRYAVTVLRSMFATRPAVAGLAFALLPTGAYGLGLALASVLAVDFGLSDDRIATLTLVGAVLSAGGCVAGGYLSDRFGRRRMIALYVLLTVVPTLAMAYQLSRFGWVHPVDPKLATRPVAPDALVASYVGLGWAFAFVQGLIWGSRTAGYMDLCNPAVAATQFTAYMSLMNLTLSYSSFWMGRAAEAIGYPKTLTIDAAAGLVCLVPLAWMGSQSAAGKTVDADGGRDASL
jgi:PAT family beta-lactamase induction signal transducer AmpG